MFNNSEFKTMEAGIRMTYLQQQLHLQNMANIDTPNYKSKSLTFDEVLSSAGGKKQVTGIRANVVEDTTTESRTDGNNVSMENENIEFYKSYAQYSALLDKIKNEFDNYSYVLNSNMK